METVETTVLEQTSTFPRQKANKRRMRLSFSMVGIGFTGMILLGTITAPLITHYNPNTNDLTQVLQAPSAAHWFGTDHLGRDLFTRVLYGGQKSLLIAVEVQLMAVLIGTMLGLFSGYFGGKTDKVIMAITNIIFSFPGLLFAIAIMAALGPSVFNLILALGFVSWPEICRLVRSQTLSLKEREFVEGGHALGASVSRILFRYILPNCYGNIAVLMTLGMATTILAESSLSFLGLGVQPPDPSWGSMVNQGKDYMFFAPWYLFTPGIVMFVTILGINLLGDVLRDYFDPKMKSSK
ncbi:peptide/nickel transport system permease protein/oligopeptide transport system permease protein [Neobacillus bataviensis]|uniref:Peptide/nickel transport system permease protein/oligopeptide transport system permease protein n=1 Tax=Neobacillus bataviensis TaxID=220685 RepID=A0A561DEN0_9BACI|nr:ABC transporter permease [Neobacillus bataviensis]TWE01850.1 peptide/nickel transport system permease protein/oligopeptide transport system permease protein [Neobacillus bataviensis]